MLSKVQQLSREYSAWRFDSQKKKMGDNEDKITNLMWHVNDFAFEALNAKQYFTELLAQLSKNIFSLIFGYYALAFSIFFIFLSVENL